MNIASEEVKAPEAPSDAIWARWRKRRFAPIWMASLLSLNVRPRFSDRNEPDVTAHPDLAAEHKERCAIIFINYGKHPHLLPVAHKRLKGSYGEVVNLEELCKFLLEVGIFSGDEPMLKFFLPAKKPQDDTSQKAEVIDCQPEVVQSRPDVIEPEPKVVPADALAEGFGHQPAVIANDLENSPSTVASKKMSEPIRGEKYMQETLGAVLIIVETLFKDWPKRECSFITKGRINQSKLGEEVAAIIKSVRASGDEEIRPIKGPGRADHINRALKMLGHLPN